MASTYFRWHLDILVNSLFKSVKKLLSALECSSIATQINDCLNAVSLRGLDKIGLRSKRASDFNELFALGKSTSLAFFVHAIFLKKYASLWSFFCRRFALVSAVAMQKMKAQRIRQRAFVTS